jgi:hypothetical protein
MTQTRRDILQAVEVLSEQYPDMRLGQLLVNLSNWATGVPDAIWDVEDEELLKAARSHLERHGLLAGSGNKK